MQISRGFHIRYLGLGWRETRPGPSHLLQQALLAHRSFLILSMSVTRKEERHLKSEVPRGNLWFDHYNFELKMADFLQKCSTCSSIAASVNIFSSLDVMIPVISPC